MADDFLHHAHIINGISPVADAFATSGTTDYVAVQNYGRIGFIIHTGDATGGTADGVVTISASDDASGSSTTAMAFTYRVCLSSTTVDTWGAQTAATSTGFAMTAGDNYIYYCEVNAEDVQAAQSGAKFVAMTVTEDTNDPIVAGILGLGLDPRYPGEVPVSAIA